MPSDGPTGGAAGTAGPGEDTPVAARAIVPPRAALRRSGRAGPTRRVEEQLASLILRCGRFDDSSTTRRSSLSSVSNA